MKPSLFGPLAGFVLGFCVLVAYGDANNKEEGMLTGSPKELLPSDTVKRDLGIKVRMRQVSPDVLDLVIPEEGGYYLEIAVHINNKGEAVALEPLIWSEKAVHEITGPVTIGGYTIVPDERSVLAFRVDVNKGYVLLRGKGKVTTPDKNTVQLDGAIESTVLGKPPHGKEAAVAEGTAVLVITKGHKAETKDKDTVKE